ncbi:MAG TPA: family 78 glycoside hydrolase catalytic domain [Sphingobium sp.]
MASSISRRGFIATAGVTTALIATPIRARPVAGLRIEAQHADGLDNPLNLHAQQVRLSWRLVSPRRDILQQAYRIGVATSRTAAEAGQFDLWDSGRVDGRQSFDVRYGGKPLASRDRCFWQVEVWDNQGQHAMSPVASWEMGLLDPRDWHAPWIAAETAPIREDRLAGLPWLTGGDGEKASIDGRSYRLPLNLPEAAEVTLFLVGNRQPEAMLDGQPLALPPRNPDAFGPPPPCRLRLSLSRGRHLLALFVPGDPRPRPDSRPPRGAMLVRADLASGHSLHITGEKARVTAGRPDGWGTPALSDSHWPAVQAVPGEGAPFPGNGAFLLRRAFAVGKPVRSARLYMTALGSYVPMLNGERVGCQAVTPEWTDFRRHVLYRAYDVTDRIKAGDNVLGAIVGDGWYGGYMAPAGRFGFGPPPLRLRAQLELDYQDGGREVIAGEDGWSLARSAITACDIYDGEEVDARRDQPGWADTGFTPPPHLWEPASPVDTPALLLVGAMLPAIEPSQTLKPDSIKQRADGSVLVDFGQNFAGWIRLRVTGETGRKIQMRYAELIGKDGAVDQASLRAAHATDSYILRGDAGGETFEPRFTYHGFRYVQIDGLPDALSADAIDGIVVHSHLPETGQLKLGQYVPQRLWQNGLWSQRSNFFGTPTDCPQRDERLGWTGDAHVFWDAACFNMDTAAFTRKFMLDIRDAQRSDGSFPDIAPNNDLAHFTPPGSSPGWGDAGVSIPWMSWQRYGDTAVIDEHWQAMVRFLGSIHKANPDFLWVKERGNDFGDWLSLDGKEPGDPTTPKDLIGTAMWKAAADAMVDMARATNRDGDVRRYQAMAASITQAFNRAYVRTDGSVGNGSQTGYIQALHFGLLPEAQRAAAVGHLVADIERRGKVLSTGFLGTPYSLDVLADAGHIGLVYDLLLRTAYPSWGYMIAHNATTTWERWNADMEGDSMNSYNHYALGAVSGFMFRRIAGISPIVPGFARFRFDPVYDPRMPNAGARYESQAGPIVTNWQRRPDGAFALDLSVPANSRCELHLPATSVAQVRADGGTATRFKAMPGRKLVLDVGSGDYAFSVLRPDYS